MKVKSVILAVCGDDARPASHPLVSMFKARVVHLVDLCNVTYCSLKLVS